MIATDRTPKRVEYLFVFLYCDRQRCFHVDSVPLEMKLFLVHNRLRIGATRFKRELLKHNCVFVH